MVQAYLQIVLARCIPLFALDDKRNVGSEDIIYRVLLICVHYRYLERKS